MKTKVLVLLAVTLLAGPMTANATYVFTTTLSGANEEPPNISAATGTATVTWDEVLQTMRVEAAFADLLGPTTAAHIHVINGPGDANTTDTLGPVATTTPSFIGFPLGVTSGSFDQTYDMTLAGSYRAGFVTDSGGTVALAQTQLFNALLGGRAYFNIHTSTYPGGEIRGFLTSSQVPEPGTLALLGLGLTGLALGRKRKFPAKPSTADVGKAPVRQSTAALILAALMTLPFGFAHAATITFEAAGPDPASITATRDAFRAAIGGGTVAGANGSFSGLRREINWDGVPDTRSDPNLLPADFFNVNSPRGVVFSTPGTGFLVSANAGGATPVLFGFPNDFQTFSAQKLFTAVSSNITDISFFLPGTTTAALISAFGLIFVDVEVAGQTRLDFFDATNTLIFSRDALVSGNQGLSFLGATFSNGGISRVRITSGSNTIVSNGILGNSNDDAVVMDDFIYAEPARVTDVPEPGTLALLGLGLAGLGMSRRRKAA